jgi:cullin 3
MPSHGVKFQMEQSGLVYMLREDKMEDLKRMYSLFGRVNSGHQIMKDLISKYIKDTGKALITDDEKQKDHLALVQALLDIKDKYDRLLMQAFNNDRGFATSLNGVLILF